MLRKRGMLAMISRRTGENVPLRRKRGMLFHGARGRKDGPPSGLLAGPLAAWGADRLLPKNKPAGAPFFP